jgi:hypothetical protein
MGRRNRAGFVWKYCDGGATAKTQIGTYHVEPAPPGMAARFGRGSDMQLLGLYPASAPARRRCEQHFQEMRAYLVTTPASARQVG